MVGHAEQCVERYLELTGKNVESLKPVATPCIDDHMFSQEELSKQGEVADMAARIVLKALYLARTNRPDIYWTVNSLAREVTRWNLACDKRLFRIAGKQHRSENTCQENLEVLSWTSLPIQTNC